MALGRPPAAPSSLGSKSPHAAVLKALLPVGALAGVLLVVSTSWLGEHGKTLRFGQSAYLSCLRSHGVSASRLSGQPGGAPLGSSPGERQAVLACGGKLSRRAEQLSGPAAAYREAFTQCLRDSGVSGGSQYRGRFSGPPPHLRDAVEACRSLAAAVGGGPVTPKPKRQPSLPVA